MALSRERLAGLLEFGLQVAAAQDREALLATVCAVGRRLFSARIAALRIVDDPSRARCCSDGAEPVDDWPADDHDRLLSIADEPAPRRLAPVPSAPPLGLPPDQPTPANALLLPLRSAGGTRGGLLFADKPGGFGADDEQVGELLAAQLAPAWERLSLVDAVQGQAARLADSEQRFRQLAEAIDEVFFLVQPEHARLLYLSSAYERIFGRPSTALFRQLGAWLDAVHPDDRARVEREVLLAQPPGQFDCEFRICRGDGALRWIRLRGFPIHDSAGALERIAGLARDVTERCEQAQRIERLTRVHRVLSGIDSAILRIRERSELLDEACRIAVDDGAYRTAAIIAFEAGGRMRLLAACGADAERLPLPDDPSGHPAAIALREDRPFVLDDLGPQQALWQPFAALGCRSLAALPVPVEGRPAAVLLLCADEVDAFDDEELRLLRALAGDIGFGLQYIAREEGLHYLACYDALTELANGTLFLDRLAQLLVGARAEGGRVAVLVLDFDRFTQINDSYGRAFGDGVLQIAARRLGQAAPAPCSVARISADMFALAVPGLSRRADVARLLNDELLPALELPFAVDGVEVQLSVRVGIALFPADGDDAATLFKNAEAALKQAQASGERFLYYAPRMNAAVSRTLALEQRLRQAFERRQFQLHYQPKLDAERQRIVGFEALARWHDPDTGLTFPGDFVPLLEETGLILDLGDWALRQALRDHGQWRRAGLAPPRVAVNVSALQLHRPDFADRVLAALADCRAEPASLELEITESLIMQDIEAGTRGLRRLRDAGVHISIDDFGTGYSSLRYLAKLPLDALKIDRSFVVTMLEDRSSMAIVSMIISLAHALQLLVIAEGVDDRSQARALARMGCNEMQGYLFSPAVAAEQAAAMLAGGRSLRLH